MSISGVPLWVKVLLAFWLALIAGCVVAELFPSEARAQQDAFKAAAVSTVEERRHQELVAALAKPPDPPDKTATIVLLVGILQVLQSLGIIGWARWSVGQIAKGEADRVAGAGAAALKEHNEWAYAHTVAAEHNHAGLIAKIEEAEGEIEKVASAVAVVSVNLQTLLSEHGLFHGGRKIRATDPPGFIPPGYERVAPGGGGGR